MNNRVNVGSARFRVSDAITNRLELLVDLSGTRDAGTGWFPVGPTSDILTGQFVLSGIRES